jgi:hypothetical protein
VFTARYALSSYIKQIRFVFKGLINSRLYSVLITIVLLFILHISVIDVIVCLLSPSRTFITTINFIFIKIMNSLTIFTTLIYPRHRRRRHEVTVIYIVSFFLYMYCDVPFSVSFTTVSLGRFPLLWFCFHPNQLSLNAELKKTTDFILVPERRASVTYLLSKEVRKGRLKYRNKEKKAVTKYGFLVTSLSCSMIS